MLFLSVAFRLVPGVSNMGRLVKFLLWLLIFVLLLVGMDQLLLRVPPVHPAHAAFSKFYRDFRTRLFSIIVIPDKETPRTVEAVIEKERQAEASALPATPKASASQSGKRFVYADGQGVLQFADSLEAVPKQYRDSAEPLGE